MGKFTNTCAGCLRPTDTGFGLVGEAEWLVAGLMQMMPEGQAIAMVERLAQDEYGCDPGCVPPIDMEVIVFDRRLRPKARPALWFTMVGSKPPMVFGATGSFVGLGGRGRTLSRR